MKNTDKINLLIELNNVQKALENRPSWRKKFNLLEEYSKAFCKIERQKLIIED